MRVLQVMAGARHGGAELFFERLTLALARKGVTQQAVIRTAPERAMRLRTAGIPAREMRFGGRLDCFTRGGLRRSVLEFQPDVALCWMSRAAQKFPRRPSVPRWPVLCARLGGYYPLKYYRHCDHLIGNTADIVNYVVAQGWPAGRAHYLPNFVESQTAPAAARHMFDTPEGASLLLAMGRLHPNKGFDVLLAALSQLPGVYLWLAGEGPQEMALRKQAERLHIADRVRFLGWRDDGPALRAASDMLICPSRMEPLGNVIIEAWAQAIPIVAASAAGPAALIHDGVSGLLVPVEDADALSAAILKIIGNPQLAGDLAVSGYKEYERCFTEAAVVARYQSFFEEVTV
ncbi:MAG: glycosyltransferase [Alphaproteobacteria bacterium]|nr:glycosyltransferase [Alphaproteobacteria bacterium]